MIKNGISKFDGEIIGATDDTVKRFESYGWHVEQIDGHDFEQLIRQS